MTETVDRRISQERVSIKRSKCMNVVMWTTFFESVVKRRAGIPICSTNATDNTYSQVIGHTSARSTSSFRAGNLFGPYPKPMADEIMSGMKLSNAPKEMISDLGEAIFAFSPKQYLVIMLRAGLSGIYFVLHSSSTYRALRFTMRTENFASLTRTGVPQHVEKYRNIFPLSPTFTEPMSIRGSFPSGNFALASL